MRRSVLFVSAVLTATCALAGPTEVHAQNVPPGTVFVASSLGPVLRMALIISPYNL